MKLTCIAVDDEPLALDVIESFLQKHPDDIQLVKKCRNALEAAEVLRHQHIDLMFLDIQMPEITGIDFIKKLENPPLVILTTAYQEYAVEGYALNVLDYLLKPISYERFLMSLNKAKEYHQLKKNDHPQVEMQADHMFVKSDQKLIKVSYDDIFYIEAFADYVKIFTKEKRIVTLQTMKNLEEKLPKTKFMRVHRSYIISLDKIKAISGNEVEIESQHIPIGKNYRDEFFSQIEKSNILR